MSAPAIVCRLCAQRGCAPTGGMPGGAFGGVRPRSARADSVVMGAKTAGHHTMRPGPVPGKLVYLWTTLTESGRVLNPWSRVSVAYTATRRFEVSSSHQPRQALLTAIRLRE